MWNVYGARAWEWWGMTHVPRVPEVRADCACLEGRRQAQAFLYIRGHTQEHTQGHTWGHTWGYRCTHLRCEEGPCIIRARVRATGHQWHVLCVDALGEKGSARESQLLRKLGKVLLSPRKGAYGWEVGPIVVRKGLEVRSVAG